MISEPVPTDSIDRRAIARSRWWVEDTCPVLVEMTFLRDWNPGFTGFIFIVSRSHIAYEYSDDISGPTQRPWLRVRSHY